MAGVFTPRDFTGGALASHSIQTAVRDVCGQDDVGGCLQVCAFLLLFISNNAKITNAREHFTFVFSVIIGWLITPLSYFRN